ncbi:hypothetical protein Scep_018999 [Stephania cephalantha]|uniref:Uncharacterized protein n=1 Tax=Stephania cephalantha TaxID=152367 RepID=A0AAP0IAA3_9MAGN
MVEWANQDLDRSGTQNDGSESSHRRSGRINTGSWSPGSGSGSPSTGSTTT